jgi:16S rRNA G966 N2-methylase RsmD
MLYGAKFAICTEINTKHKNIVWQNVKFLNVKPVGASLNQ